MTVAELVTELLSLPQDWEIYVDNPSRTHNYFIEGVTVGEEDSNQVFIQTAD